MSRMTLPWAGLPEAYIAAVTTRTILKQDKA